MNLNDLLSGIDAVINHFSQYTLFQGIIFGVVIYFVCPQGIKLYNRFMGKTAPERRTDDELVVKLEQFAAKGDADHANLGARVGALGDKFGKMETDVGVLNNKVDNLTTLVQMLIDKFITPKDKKK